jgi:hypothetical protein
MQDVMDLACQQTAPIHHVFGGHLQSQVCIIWCTYLSIYVFGSVDAFFFRVRLDEKKLTFTSSLLQLE